MVDDLDDMSEGPSLTVLLQMLRILQVCQDLPHRCKSEGE